MTPTLAISLVSSAIPPGLERKRVVFFNYEFENLLLGRILTFCIAQRNEANLTLDTKHFDYLFLATLDERGQSIPTMGIKEGGERVSNVTRIKT